MQDGGNMSNLNFIGDVTGMVLAFATTKVMQPVNRGLARFQILRGRPRPALLRARKRMPTAVYRQGD
jgi:hypothetical protein